MWLLLSITNTLLPLSFIILTNTLPNNPAPTNKTEYPVKRRYFRVKSIAKGYYETLGFDIALLMIANSFEEIDENDERSDRPFGFPPKFSLLHRNESNYFYGIPNCYRTSNGGIPRTENNMLGCCGIIPTVLDRESTATYAESKLCIYS